MKKFLIASIVCFVLINNVNAGSFALTVNDTVKTGGINSMVSLTGTLSADSFFPVSIRLTIFRNLGSSDWHLSMCTPAGTCGDTTLVTIDFDIMPGSNHYIATNFYTGNDPHTGSALVRFENIADSTDYLEFTFTAISKAPTAIEDIGNVNGSFLLQNYPNPFSLNTSIQYKTTSTDSRIVLRNATGKKIDEFPINKMQEGEIKINKQLPSGIYFYSLYEKGMSVATRKMIVLE